IVQETRGFDALKGITISQRSKEAANDYRYFPEPDLQPLVVMKEDIEAIKSEMPALPRELFNRYTKEYGLSDYDAYNLTDNKGIALFYESLIQHTKNYKAAANWMMGDVKSYLNEFGFEIHEFPISVERLANLIAIIDEGKVSNSVASQRIFPEMLKSDLFPLTIAEQLNLIQDSSEDTLKDFILQVFEENQAEVERYRNGEKQLTGFFMGKLMKVSNGKADPKIANKLLRELLEA
ncbi:MAG: Asp-tRNA(Asn)/Glu-tRNA(Gln) amidotransferase GatCAB subunit B, partial [Crocinitomicaceae bacterium]|nr:Asp-tRNA(Asn)/Glu-tRNA(Gln) amidotransferase GatCAB subunit B [Crocinitomicaceae bacterium]